MKITRLDIQKVPPSWVWLKVYTDDGQFGLGEPFLEGHPDSVIAEVRRLEPLLLGQDPRQLESLWQQLYEAGTGYKGGPVTMSAISGIDIALWDLAGKTAGLPIHQLLGGATRDRIRMYRATGPNPPHTVAPGLPYRAGVQPYGANVQTDRVQPGQTGVQPDQTGVQADLAGAQPGRTGAQSSLAGAQPGRVGDIPAPNSEPAAWAESAAILVREWGFRCLKAHFSVGDGLAATGRVKHIAECFAAVRAGAGPDIDVAVDLHNPHPAIAAQLIEALLPYRPLFIEEPMPIERVDVLARLAQQCTGAPIAAGERWMGKWVFFDAISRGALSVVQPDIAHAGGITECQKIAAIAEAGYASVAMHCPLSPVALAAAIQLDAVLPNFLVQEHNEVNDTREHGRTRIGVGYLAEPFTLDEQGCVAVPTGPGLGIEPDEDGLREIMAQPWSTERG